MTARGDAFRELQLPDMERRLADLIKIGTVSQIDYGDAAGPRVKVKYGKNTTGWLPWTAARAGRARTWHPLKVGEQVIIASPSGDMAQGVIVGSLNSNSRQAPATGAHETVTEWDGGIRESLDDDTNIYKLDVPAGGKIILQCGQSNLEITSEKTTLTTPSFYVDSPISEFSGMVLIQKLLTFLGGLMGSNVNGGAVAGGGVASMQGKIQHRGDYDHSDGSMTSNDVTVHTHEHGGVTRGTGNTDNPIAGT